MSFFSRRPASGAFVRRHLVGSTAAIVGLCAASAGFAAPHPVAVPDASSTPFAALATPLGASNALVTYIVELGDDAVTVASAKSAQPMSAQQERQTADSIKAKQTQIEQQIQAAGGKVMADYQYAYNGIRVRIAEKDASKLAALSGVVAVHRAGIFKPDNVHGVPLIGGPAVWGGVPGFRGENIKIAVIDTGIDYTHADFGGPGTVAAYQNALATDTAAAPSSLFGPGAPKVKGGIDLVGDDYNADPSSPSFQPVPHPDSNPLDCNGHGTHVSGTATGFGVRADGTRYTGAYDANTISSNSFLVGPGVAPRADLYAVRVFGCAGSTDVVVDALEWAVRNRMNVVNMSLGSSFGAVDSPDAVASYNAVNAGIIVVASAGNSGPIPYIVGSPSTGNYVISVAASDPTPSFPGASIALPATTLTAINANGATFADPLTGQVTVVRSGSGIALGCSASDYVGVAGKIAVVRRGTCSRVARAIFGQQAGAIAVVMVNNANSLPPFEGPITTSAETGAYNVTIPFFGTSSSTTAAWLAADTTTASITNAALANPGFLAPASFTSQGPRLGRSGLKPEVTAPGVSIASAGFGTGNSFAVLSGTSMAAPHTAGASALVKQAHPTWRRASDLAAALVNTTDPAQVTPYAAHTAGGGLVQALPATRTDVVAVDDANLPSLDYGFAELTADFAVTRRVNLKNMGSSAATFTAAITNAAGRPHSAVVPSTPITVPAGGSVSVNVQLNVPAATAGTSSALNEVSGLVVFAPSGGTNNGVTLRVPYYLVPQAVSVVNTNLKVDALRRTGAANATTTNVHGAAPGSADWYAWGLSKPTASGLGASDLRAVGVQTDGSANLAFAVLTHQRWSTPFEAEFDIYVDVNGDGVDDYIVFGGDNGLLTTGTRSGLFVSAVFDLRTSRTTIRYRGEAPFNSTSVVLPVQIAQLCASGSPCLSAATPRLIYHVIGFDNFVGGSNTISGTASFHAFAPSLSTGLFDTVAPDASAAETATYNAAESALTPALGFMIVSHDNQTGREAQLIPVAP